MRDTERFFRDTQRSEGNKKIYTKYKEIRVKCRRSEGDTERSRTGHSRDLQGNLRRCEEFHGIYREIWERHLKIRGKYGLYEVQRDPRKMKKDSK
jgi:hypothetical protein